MLIVMISIIHSWMSMFNCVRWMRNGWINDLPWTAISSKTLRTDFWAQPDRLVILCWDSSSCSSLAVYGNRRWSWTALRKSRRRRASLSPLKPATYHQKWFYISLSVSEVVDDINYYRSIPIDSCGGFFAAWLDGMMVNVPLWCTWEWFGSMGEHNLLNQRKIVWIKRLARIETLAR